MKKSISLLLIALMLFTLSACGKAEVPEASTTQYTADYLTDSSVLIISEKADIDIEAIKDHYENGGIVLVKNWKLASDVQSIIATTMSISFTKEDSAVIFYLDAQGIPGMFVTGGNSSTLDYDIDGLIKEAKNKQ